MPAAAPVAAAPQLGEPDAEPFERVGAEPGTLVLGSAGAEPRRLLQFNADGPARQIRLSWRLLAPPGMPEDFAMGLEFDLAWTPQPPDRWEFQIDKAVSTAFPGAAADEQAVFDTISSAFAQVRGAARLHGARRLELTQTHGVATQPSLPHLLHAFAPVWPEAPIGVGARWTVSAPVTTTDLVGAEVREFELVALDEGRATVQVETHTRFGAAGQADAEPVMATAASARLELDLGDPLARSGEVTFSSAMRFPGADALPPLEANLRATLAPRP